MEQGPFTIDLTPEEIALADALQFNPLAFQGSHDAFITNAELARRLTTSLLERHGIPEQRLQYFADPECYPGGRGRSRKQGFERNGTHGDAMLRHPHFLKYLHYFIHGADLPTPVMEAFALAVEACGPVSSGDIPPLGATARKLARNSHLESKSAADEFFKLCLDLGLSPSRAASIRSSVLQLRGVC